MRISEGRKGRIWIASNLVGGAWTENTVGNMTSGPTLNSNGRTWTMSVAGGKQLSSLTAPDPDDAVCTWAAHALLDANGQPLTGEIDAVLGYGIYLPNQLSINDNIMFGMHIGNYPSPIGANFTGIGAMLEFVATQANPRVRYSTAATGTFATSNNGSANANVSGAKSYLYKFCAGPSGNASIQPALGVVGTYADGSRINGAGATATLGSNNPGTGQLYAIIWVARLLSGDAGVVTPAEVGWWYSPAPIAAYDPANG